MYVVAHEDDDLLFQSPALAQDINSGRCVRTVFLTAGDSGLGSVYWHGREEGVEAAYAQMAGAANNWTGSTITAHGHSIHLETLNASANVSLVFMRLPDGGVNGKGAEAYGFQSLLKLWDGGNPGSGRPTIGTITAVDGSATYGYTDLIETLAALMNAFEPQQLSTQDYAEGIFEGDHPDHITTAYFTRQAQKLYAAPHRLLAYAGYNVTENPTNVSGELLGVKDFAFYTYGAHDSGACASEAGCATTPYASWLPRQYVTATETVGVVAHAGYAQMAAPSSVVSLDGSRSSDQSGEPLEYQWSQTGGPPVSLSGATTATPSFLAPSHPALLTFSLKVKDGATSSKADTVRVKLPSADPSPTAIAGSGQTVSSGATVSLDGSASWDPNSEPLEYAWIQTAGPAVTLTGASTATPSFHAPTGPATLKFSLVVSNGDETSAPSVVTIEVLGIAPAFTSPAAAAFTTGIAKTITISPTAALSRTGALPPGLSFTDNGDGSAKISGTPSQAAAPPAQSLDYPLTLSAQNAVSTTTQNFTLTVTNPGTAPAFTSPAAAAFTTGIAKTITISTTAAPTAALSRTGALPPGLSFTDNGDGSAKISGTPSQAAAPPAASLDYPLTLSAQNAVSTTTQNFTLTVTNPEGEPEPPEEPEEPEEPALVAPALAAPSIGYGFVGQPLTLPVAATGTPVPAISLLGPAPSGLDFQPTGPGSASLIGTPTQAQVSHLAVVASSLAGSVTQALTLVVEPAPRLSSARVDLPLGKRSRRVVAVLGGDASPQRCSGRLPGGVRCQLQTDKVVIESSAAARRRGTYRLVVDLTGPAGTVKRQLTVRLRPADAGGGRRR
jgi:LmbE family N-acetylglucosaminyl deacetylase